MSANGLNVYQHPKTTKNGMEHRWYYYYYDLGGKKFQKACKGCVTRGEAESYISRQLKLLDENKLKSFH